MLADASGTVRGIGMGGASNPNAVTVDVAMDSVRAAVTAALSPSHASASQISAVFMGMAGIVSEEEHALARRIAAAAGLNHVDTDHDVRIALAGGLAGEAGIALIVGTGSAAYGRTEDGRAWASGGWGALVDDGGSAYGLGLEALRAVVRSADGRIEPTKLLDAVLAELKLSKPRELVGALYQKGMNKTEIAALAPLVISIWQDGDDVAGEVVQRGAEELALAVMGVYTSLRFDPTVRVCTTGGLIEGSDPYRAFVYDVIRRKIGDSVRLATPLMPPVLGATVLAMKSKLPGNAVDWHKLLRSYGELLQKRIV